MPTKPTGNSPTIQRIQREIEAAFARIRQHPAPLPAQPLVVAETYTEHEDRFCKRAKHLTKAALACPRVPGRRSDVWHVTAPTEKAEELFAQALRRR
jgi:hypothetical protein